MYCASSQQAPQERRPLPPFEQRPSLLYEWDCRPCNSHIEPQTCLTLTSGVIKGLPGRKLGLLNMHQIFRHNLHGTLGNSSLAWGHRTRSGMCTGSEVQEAGPT